MAVLRPEMLKLGVYCEGIRSNTVIASGFWIGFRIGETVRRIRLRNPNAMAMGSVREVQCIFDLNADSFSAQQHDMLDHLAASIYKLTRWAR